MDAHGAVNSWWRRVVQGVLCSMASVLVVQGDAGEKTGTDMMQLISDAFVEGASIPLKHTCDGRNVSPALKWSGVPGNARSLALIADDPDAPGGTWVHWVLFDLPPGATSLHEDVAKMQHAPGGAKQGLNDFKHLGYGGPCPPPGNAHRYYFKLYALDTALDLKPGTTKEELEHAMAKHIVAQAQLMGTYKRK